MDRCLLLIVSITLLWHTCLSANECNRTISGGAVTFACPSNISSQELSLYDLSTTQLDSITSIVATGIGATSVGPFTSIPPNICLLGNLQSIAFPLNQIVQVDPTGSLMGCLSNVVTLDLRSNNISTFPSVLIYNMSSLKNLYFQNNHLTEVPVYAFRDVSSLEIIDFSYNLLTTFELWTLEVKTRADFSHNQISAITNKYFFVNTVNRTIEHNVSITNNNPIITFTDVIYEMYGQCKEVFEYYFSSPTVEPWFTWKLAHLDFGTTQINCSCAQHYFLRIFHDYILDPSPIENAICANHSRNVNDITFFNSSCADPTFDVNSTANFAEVTPRLCKIVSYEVGNLTTITNTSLPSLNVSTYPYYKTALLNPGACFFTFSNTTTMSMACSNDTSNSASAIPADLLSSPYMSNISRITFPSLISSLPSYLCSLPSRQIDLSSQAFTTLSDATFPCLDSFQTVKLSSNQITSVNMASGNFTNLTSLDLSSNQLTMLPYSILRPTPTSLRYLDLRNNAITYIDLFLYTLQSITINLDNNLINSSNILNLQNITLANYTNSTATITFPSSVTNSTIIIQDTLALAYGLCNNFQSLRNFLLKDRSLTSNVLLRCTCASINLRNLYQQNQLSITNDFNCSNATEGQTFNSLTLATCPNAANFQSGLCSNQIPQDTTSSELGGTSTYTGVTLISTMNGSQITLSSSPNDTTTTILSPSNNISITTNSTVSTSTATMIISNTSSSSSSTTVPGVLQSGDGSDSNSNRTGLIVGLVVGIVGYLALVGGLVAAYLILKKKAAAKKPVSRAKVVGQAPGDSLSSRVQPRNLRSVKLAPIKTTPAPLPAAPVAAVVPTTTSSTIPYSNMNGGTSAKGIPLRLEPIRSPSNINPQYPPNSNASNSSASFRPINNPSASQGPTPQQQYQVPRPQKPRTTQTLNAGGNRHYTQE